MASPKLDENNPGSVSPDEVPIPEGEGTAIIDTSPAGGESKNGVAESIPATSAEERIEFTSAEPSETPTEGLEVEEQSISETQPSMTSDDGIILPPEIPELPPDTPKGKRTWILWAFLGVLILALIAGGSGFAGYSSAIDQRTRHESTQMAGEAANQYVLAQEDIAQGNYDLARQRLEYLIQIDPNYPNVSEQLAFVLTQQRITASPTFAPTPTLTPTPDYRTRDELFAQAQNMLVGREWTNTIDTLLLLRKNYPDFMAVKVDDMLFVALRNRGVDKIAQLHDLEGGNYDLTLAERFGPLDSEARNWRDWAELYIRGASFWDVDWGQALSYFSELASAAPNLSDISGWTASNRYLDALLGYGEWLSNKGLWCDAQAQYDTYMTQLASSQVEPTAVFVAEQCAQGAGAPGTPAGEGTPTTGTPAPTDSLIIPITDTPIPTDTQQPTLHRNYSPIPSLSP
jgi:tetratricopeptide (TPR) repeat protein